MYNTFCALYRACDDTCVCVCLCVCVGVCVGVGVGVCMCGCACGCYMPLLIQSGVSALMIEVAGRCRMEVVEELVKAGANLNLHNNVCLNIYISRLPYKTGVFIPKAQIVLVHTFCLWW